MLDSWNCEITSASCFVLLDHSRIERGGRHNHSGDRRQGVDAKSEYWHIRRSSFFHRFRHCRHCGSTLLDGPARKWTFWGL